MYILFRSIGERHPLFGLFSVLGIFVVTDCSGLTFVSVSRPGPRSVEQCFCVFIKRYVGSSLGVLGGHVTFSITIYDSVYETFRGILGQCICGITIFLVPVLICAVRFIVLCQSLPWDRGIIVITLVVFTIFVRDCAVRQTVSTVCVFSLSQHSIPPRGGLTGLCVLCQLT